MGVIYAADHCTENRDCNRKNSYPEDEDYLPGCGYEIVGGSQIMYFCTPEDAEPLVTCPEGEHLEDSGPYGTSVCVYDETGGIVNTSRTDPICRGDPTGISTAIGCIHILDTPEAFLADILKWAVGIGSGIAFLLMLYAGFMIMTASGSPERLKAGQELLTSALAGLILLIFSIFILKFIGVDILGLGQFGFGGS